MTPVKFAYVTQKPGGCYAVDVNGGVWEWTASIAKWKQLPHAVLPEGNSAHGPVTVTKLTQPAPVEPAPPSEMPMKKRGRGRPKHV